ncbi:MAG: hypothetical protein K2N03_07020 [Muribaculaceae bacterium]|nr:hypothetical protein [Muribaculaceae bacterium]
MKKYEEILDSTVPTLVVFEHAGKHNSVDVKYLMQELGVKYEDKLQLKRIDCSYNGKWKARYGFKDYPTWILFKEGQELMRESGEKSIAKLEEMVGRAL